MLRTIRYLWFYLIDLFPFWLISFSLQSKVNRFKSTWILTTQVIIKEAILDAETIRHSKFDMMERLLELQTFYKSYEQDGGWLVKIYKIRKENCWAFIAFVGLFTLTHTIKILALPNNTFLGPSPETNPTFQSWARNYHKQLF